MKTFVFVALLTGLASTSCHHAAPVVPAAPTQTELLVGNWILRKVTNSASPAATVFTDNNNVTQFTAANQYTTFYTGQPGYTAPYTLADGLIRFTDPNVPTMTILTLTKTDLVYSHSGVGNLGAQTFTEAYVRQ